MGKVKVGEGIGVCIVYVSLPFPFLYLPLSLSPLFPLPSLSSLPSPRFSQTSFLDNLVEQTHPGMTSAEDKNVSYY